MRDQTEELLRAFIADPEQVKDFLSRQLCGHARGLCRNCQWCAIYDDQARRLAAVEKVIDSLAFHAAKLNEPLLATAVQHLRAALVQS